MPTLIESREIYYTVVLEKQKPEELEDLINA